MSDIITLEALCKEHKIGPLRAFAWHSIFIRDFWQAGVRLDILSDCSTV